MADLLHVENLSAGYGAAGVLRGVSFSLAAGQSMAVLGRNGVGKTTLINSIVGLTRHMGGTIRLDGADITALPPDARARAGIGWVPQERDIFRSLTVQENLTVVARPGLWTVEKIFALFPRLRAARANMGNQLSGGEQQMLAVGRALMLNPKLLLLDEPTEGLAPILVADLLAVIQRILREEGMAALVVEQHATRILGVTDHAIVLERGAIALAAPSAALRADPAKLEQYLSVKAG